jgi:folate-binding protein YgfZ
MTSSDPLTLELLAGGPFVRDAAPYRLLQVAGADAADFLQRLCTQDLLALRTGGDAAPAAFLDPKGKVVVTCLALRTAAGFLLETQAAQHGALLAVLERFHFTERVTFATPAVACRERIAAAGTAMPAAPPGAATFAWSRRGVQFARWHAEAAGALPAVAGKALGDDLAECLRMGAGIVRVGVDTEPATLGLEADLDDHCSTTKGCYTGQEIVARIHTYGHTNRALCLLHLVAGPRLGAPAVLHEPEDKLAVGRVMAAVPVPGRAVRVGLGYLPKDFQPIGTKLLLADGSAVTVAGFAKG